MPAPMNADNNWGGYGFNARVKQMAKEQGGLGNDARNRLDDMATSLRRRYSEDYRPINQELIDSVDSTALVDAAKANAGDDFQEGLRRAARQRQRYGGGQASSVDKSRRAYSENLRGALSYDAAVNTARQQQYERNTGLRKAMVDQGRTIATDAMGKMTTAADMITRREMHEDMMRQQKRRSRMALATSVIGTAIALA